MIILSNYFFAFVITEIMASVQNQVEVQGTFKNDTFAKLELMHMEIYSGHFADGGPNAVLEQGDKTTFKHIGEPSPEGSKVGVSYRGPNDDQWVFAWHAPGPYPVELPAIELKKKVLLFLFFFLVYFI